MSEEQLIDQFVQADLGEVKEGSYYEIAKFIFGEYFQNKPREPNTVDIMPEFEEEDGQKTAGDNEMIFQLLINVLVSGWLLGFKSIPDEKSESKQVLTLDKMKHFEMFMQDEKNQQLLDKHCQSLGFDLWIKIFDAAKVKQDKYEYEDLMGYYCRISLKFLDQFEFLKDGIDEEYRFKLNGNFNRDKEILGNYDAVFNFNGKIYQFYFTQHKLIKPIHETKSQVESVAIIE